MMWKNKIKWAQRRCPGQSGFTLMEVMVAITILAVSAIVLTDSMNTSILLSERAEKTTIASLLAKQKMAEMEIEIQKEGFPSEEKELSGEFDKDYENDLFEGYRWEATISKIKIAIPESFFDMAMGEQSGGVQIGPGIINDLISDNIREISLTVFWPIGRKNEGSFSVTYHVTQ